MYQERTGTEPDLVVVADLVATGDLLSAFPGVTVDGTLFDAQSLATDFLYQTYQDHPDRAEQNRYLVGVFTQVFGQVVAIHPDGPALVGAPYRRRPRRGGSMAWAPDPAIEEGLAEPGIGRVSPTERPTASTWPFRTSGPPSWTCSPMSTPAECGDGRVRSVRPSRCHGQRVHPAVQAGGALLRASRPISGGSTCICRRGQRCSNWRGTADRRRGTSEPGVIDRWPQC